MFIVTVFVPVTERAGASTPTLAITSYRDPSIYVADGITAGPDGAVWYTNATTSGVSIGRITTAGAVTDHELDTDTFMPHRIVTGPDGALWFTNHMEDFYGNYDSIGRITPAGVATTFSDPGIVQPHDITVGPDGALWFTYYDLDHSGIGRITTAGVITTFTDATIDSPEAITAGPDGALWFTNTGNNSIGRITTAGVVSNYTDPSITVPLGIVAGPDGALWFTNNFPSDSVSTSIGRITTSGIVTSFPDPSILTWITRGPDGALWYIYGNDTDNGIARITTSGVITHYTAPGITSPANLTTGPDGALWVVDTASDGSGALNGSIARVVLSSSPTSTTTTTVNAPPTVSTTAPSSAVQLSTGVPVRWSGSDANGIAHFDVRTAAASWNGSMSGWTAWLSATSATSANWNGTDGHTYCFAARAQDGLGAVSAWTPSRCTAVPLRSDHLVHSSGWTKSTSSSFYAGFAYSSTLHGTAMTRPSIVATKLSLVATKCGTCGTVQARWNGAIIANVNLASATTLHKQVIPLATFSTAKTGTLALTVTSSTGKVVTIEGLAVSNA